jgi:hypothetical protein
MVWVYYSAQIFLFGAEFTWVYAHELGSRRGEPRPRPAEEAQPRHAAFPLPRRAANEALATTPLVQPPRRSGKLAAVRRRLSGARRRHPFGSLGIAFLAGAALGVAKAFGIHRVVKRRWA